MNAAQTKERIADMVLPRSTGRQGGLSRAPFAQPKGPSPRTVFTPGDYVYPNELRVSSRDHVVYGRASGLAGGITQTTKIFAYDLDAPGLVESAEVAPHLLPPAREAVSPRPGR